MIRVAFKVAWLLVVVFTLVTNALGALAFRIVSHSLRGGFDVWIAIGANIIVLVYVLSAIERDRKWFR